MTNFFQILNSNLNSGNSEAIDRVCDRLKHARANTLKDRVVAKSVFSGLRVNPSAPRDPCPMAWTNAQAIKAIKAIKATLQLQLETGEEAWARPATPAHSSASPAYSSTSPAYSSTSPPYSPHTWLTSPAVEWAVLIIQRAWRGRVAKNFAGAVAAALTVVAVAKKASASLNIQRMWRARVAKNIAADLIKKRKKSTTQIAVKSRSVRKRKLASASFSDYRKKARNNAQAKLRRAKRKREEKLNARAAKRFRELIEHVRDYDDHILETFESEVLNEKGIFDFDSDSDGDDEGQLKQE